MEVGDNNQILDIFGSWYQWYFLTDWTWSVREIEEPRKTARVLTWTGGKMDLSFTKMRKTRSRFEGENQYQIYIYICNHGEMPACYTYQYKWKC